MAQEPDFFAQYFECFANTEPPNNYHRWCLLTGVAALLGRRFWFKFGDADIYPNMYTFLIGNPGTRKSTSIKSMRRLLMETGYETVAADKTSKEKFLLDLYEGTVASTAAIDRPNGHDYLDKGEFSDEDREVFIIAADDFSDFTGSGNFDFISLLGNLWDYTGIYRARVKNSKSVAIPNPTLNILSGNTPTSFASAFPPEAVGQGFISRIILVHGEPSGKRITIPQVSDAARAAIVQKLVSIRTSVFGQAKVSEAAGVALDRLYQKQQPQDDIRLAAYSTRRFTHLLKLTLLCTAIKESTTITVEDITLANTILTTAEAAMGKALGEFGKGKFSDATQKVMEALYATSKDKPLNLTDLFKVVKEQLDKWQDLGIVMQNLQQADKIVAVKVGDKHGFLPKLRPLDTTPTEFLDFNLLTPQEVSND